ncbi:hypothetical protein [Acinetobacter tianfuensis]|nr:hypothetical protein [Acinetobacter tianfuensis]
MMHDDYYDNEPVTRIAANQSKAQRASKVILKDAQNYLDSMSQGEHTFLMQTLEKLAAEEPYFQVLADELNQPNDAKVANDALNLLHFWQRINDEDDIQNFDLLNVIQADFFQLELFDALDQMLPSEHLAARKVIIQQTIAMYGQGFYAGCIPALYAQLEGLLTDVLLAKGFLQENGTKLVDVYKIVPGLKGSEIKSLWHKSKIALELNGYFAELAAYKMDSSSTVTATRHNMLHGTDVANFNRGRSFVLFLWLFSAVSFMSSIKA